MRIPAGKMRKTITIERPGTPGTLGQTTWTPFITTRAQLLAMTGRELNAAQITGSEVSHKFVLRYQSGVTAAMRVTMDGRVFRIVYPLTKDEGNAQLLELYAKEVLAV